MSINIPPAGGVPGISGPPDWFSGPPTGNFRLDDVRWRGATHRTFGGGASQSASFRAVHSTVGAQKHIYLSFRAAFVQALNDQYDVVYLGLQKHGGAKAMVIRLQVHGPVLTHAGPPPDNNPPTNISTVQISTRSAPATNWTIEAMTPTWITSNVRAWLQSATDVPSDPNNRWAIQLRIPVTAGMADITDNSGPNLGADFDMWYVVHASTSIGNPVILADYRASGATTELDLVTGNYPLPGAWDEFLLASGPGANGGVRLDWGDVVVQNIHGEGWKIANGQNNSFVCRPRNYTNTSIPAGNINATFRIANWGSTASGNPNFATGQWDYVPGNDALTPVISNAAIPSLPAGNNPPATTPIKLDVVMNLGAGKSLHQCILTTLSGTNLNLLNDSIYANMNFDQASLLEREAEISVVGLAPFSPRPRDVYLAVEKVNMVRNLPAGANEGRFLQNSMARLMAQGGALAEKIKAARTRLSGAGDYGSGARLDNQLGALRRLLAGLSSDDVRGGSESLDQLISSLRQWLLAVKTNEGAAKRLAVVFDALADWLLTFGPAATGKLDAFITQLGQWLSGLNNDPASSELAPGVARALRAWLSTLAGGGELAGIIERIGRWLSAGRPAAQLMEILNALRALLSSRPAGDDSLRVIIAAISSATSTWLKGRERLDVFINVLSDVGLTEDELDQLFPTFRVHVYHDTGERVAGSDGRSRPALRAQSSFGLYTYHEGALEGWQTSIQGAQRIADNLYLVSAPNNGSAKINIRIQAVDPGTERIPDDPIIPIKPEDRGGCLRLILKLLGLGK